MTMTDTARTARLAGIFGVKLPVSDLATARAWYERLFDLRLIFEFPDEDGTAGARPSRRRGWGTPAWRCASARTSPGCPASTR